MHQVADFARALENAPEACIGLLDIKNFWKLPVSVGEGSLNGHTNNESQTMKSAQGNNESRVAFKDFG